MRFSALLGVLAISVIPDVESQAFLCLYDTEPLLDWIKCLTLVFPKILIEEGAKLRQRFYKNMEPVDITLKICSESPQLVANYTKVVRKFLKKIPEDVMEIADYHAEVCANNTAYKFPLKNKNGEIVHAYSVTLENLDEIRGTPASTTANPK